MGIFSVLFYEKFISNIIASTIQANTISQNQVKNFHLIVL